MTATWLNEPMLRALNILMDRARSNLAVRDYSDWYIAPGNQTEIYSQEWDRDRVVIVNHTRVSMKWLREHPDYPMAQIMEVAFAFNEEANLCAKYGHRSYHNPLSSLDELPDLIALHRAHNFQGGDMYILGYKFSDIQEARAFR